MYTHYPFRGLRSRALLAVVALVAAGYTVATAGCDDAPTEPRSASQTAISRLESDTGTSWRVVVNAAGFVEYAEPAGMM